MLFSSLRALRALRLCVKDWEEIDVTVAALGCGQGQRRAPEPRNPRISFCGLLQVVVESYYNLSKSYALDGESMTKRRKTPDDPSLRSSVSETEFEVLRVLWKHGPGTVRTIDGVLKAQGRSWAYTTVLTLLQRLQAKGYVSRETQGVAHVYRAAVTREKLLTTRLWELADRFTDGATTPIVQALVDGHRFTSDEIEQFRQLLDQAEAKDEVKKKRSKKRKPRAK